MILFLIPLPCFRTEISQAANFGMDQLLQAQAQSDPVRRWLLLTLTLLLILAFVLMVYVIYKALHMNCPQV